MTKKNYRKLACAVALATSFASLPGVSSAEEGNEPETAVTAQADGAATQQSAETVTAQDVEAAPQQEAGTVTAQDAAATAQQSAETAQETATPQDAPEATPRQAAGDEAGKAAAAAGNDRIRDWAKLRPTCSKWGAPSE